MVGFISKRAMAKSRWLVTLEEDGDDLIIPFPEDLLLQAGWVTGDTIEWKDMGDGSWQLINMKLSKDGLTNPKTTV